MPESIRGRRMPFVTEIGGEPVRAQGFGYGVSWAANRMVLGTLRLLPCGYPWGQQRDKRHLVVNGTCYALSRDAPKMLIDSYSVPYYHEGKSCIVRLSRRDGAGLEANEG